MASDSTVYVGGGFSTVGGKSRQLIAALDARTGLATEWDPAPQSGGVGALVVHEATVYVGGLFTRIGGQPRGRIAELDRVTGAATPWNPGEGGPVYALAVNAGTIYAGGHFLSIGGKHREHLAALDATTGAATAWDPAPSGDVLSLALSEGKVYAGGQFATIGGEPRSNIAALDARSGAPTAWNPHANGRVDALALSGGTLYVGGSFGTVGNQSRWGLAALDATTGAVTSWNPELGNEGGYPAVVYTLKPNAGTVYVGGWFTSVGGQARNCLAAIDATTGMATAWNPSPDVGPFGYIYVIELVGATASVGTTVYVAGTFTSLGGAPRSGLAAVDATGGATAWAPEPDGAVHALTSRGTTVYAGGHFAIIGGQPRNNMAALDGSTGAAASWDPDVGGGDPPTVTALAVSGNTVYAGGNFTTVGGQDRARIAAVDVVSGAPTPWNPAVHSYLGGGVLTLAVSGNAVYAGGILLDSVEDHPQASIAAIFRRQFHSVPAPSPHGPETRMQVSSVGPNPARNDVVVEFSLSQAGRVRATVYDVAGRFIDTLGDGLQPPGVYTVKWSARDARGVRVGSGVYFVRLTDERTTETRKVVIQR